MGIRVQDKLWNRDGIYFLLEDSSPSNDPYCPLPFCLEIHFISYPPPPLVCACDTHSTCVNADFLRLFFLVLS